MVSVGNTFLDGNFFVFQLIEMKFYYSSKYNFCQISDKWERVSYVTAIKALIFRVGTEKHDNCGL